MENWLLVIARKSVTEVVQVSEEPAFDILTINCK